MTNDYTDNLIEVGCSLCDQLLGVIPKDEWEDKPQFCSSNCREYYSSDEYQNLGLWILEEK